MKTKTDLSLVPVEDLVMEISARHSSIVIAGSRFIDQGPSAMYFYSKSPTFTESLGLCELLKQDIIDNYYEANNQND